MSDKLLSDWLVRDPGSNTPLLNPQYGQVLLTTSPVRRVSCQVQSGRKYWSDLVDRIYSDSVLGEDSSPSVLSILWWCALTAPAGWTRIRSETSVVGRRRVMIRAKYCFEDNIESDVEVSTLADVSKDKNETEEFISAVYNDGADDITKHEEDNPKLHRKGTAEIA